MESNQRDGGSYGDFVAGRVARLIRPTAVFIGVWLAVALITEIAAPATSSLLQPAMAVVARPLWFIAVYLVVVAAAPVMISLHRKHGAGVLAVMIASVAAIDVLRIAVSVPLIGWLNFAFVWLFAHQLGFFYGDGTLSGWSRGRLATLMVSGLGALALLTAIGPYSPSMVGMADGRISNNDPPSLAMVALTLWLIGGAMLLRSRISIWLEGRRAWSTVVAANSVIMTAFLWHLTALLLAVLVLYPLGWPQAAGGTAAWWLLRPVWMLALSLFLIPFIALFARFERSRTRTIDSSHRSHFRIAAGITALTFGIAGFATGGFGDILTSSAPIMNAALIGGGALLIGRELSAVVSGIRR
jgi:hypothetical protein